MLKQRRRVKTSLKLTCGAFALVVIWLCSGITDVHPEASDNVNENEPTIQHDAREYYLRISKL